MLESAPINHFVEFLLRADFPSRPPSRVNPHPRLIEGLGTQPLEILAARDYLAVFATEEEVRTLQPNFDVLAALDRFAVIATAPGNHVDFVSRFFAPAQGLNEDPVTGSAHCTLTPYWSRRLARKQLHALQVSARGGELWLEDRGERTLISGYVTPYLEGTLSL
jgi:predicted PhzF superfamily epimerase YddE/YHI9